MICHCDCLGSYQKEFFRRVKPKMLFYLGLGAWVNGVIGQDSPQITQTGADRERFGSDDGAMQDTKNNHFVARKFRLCRSERGFLIDPGWAIVEWRSNRMRKIPLGSLNIRFNRIVHFGWAALLVAGLCTWLFAPAAKADCGSATARPNRSRHQGSAQLKGEDRKETGLEITLVNGKGLPIASAKVSLENKRRHIRVVGMTDAQGQVHIALPDAGRYRVKIVFPDKRHEDFWEEVDQHQLVQLKITYPPPQTLSPCDDAEPDSQVSTVFYGT
ncbi:MAG TPA: carboxypeptidase-like regulatory domain-containing protein, partial [Candidatus Angelobacter sp.]|nr:carboxypeptidase-like regulatory domain-containing protein [Candidatus Angelobacter sp.]